MEVLRRLVAACRPQSALLIPGILFALLNNFAGLLPSVLIQQAIDRAIPAGDTGLLVRLAGLVALLALGRSVAIFLNVYFIESSAQKTCYQIRNRLFDHLQRLSFRFYDQAQTGQLMSRAIRLHG